MICQVDSVKILLESIQYFANMADPIYKGHMLNSEQEEQTEMWVIEYNPVFISPPLAFKIEDPGFHLKSVWK